MTSTKLPTLVGTSEAARIIGVEVPRITRWRKDDKLPQPVATLASTTVWLKSDIDKFSRARRKAGNSLPNVSDWKSSAPIDLAGTAEAAERIGRALEKKIDKSQVGRWRRAGTFPDPVQMLGASPVWSGEQIDAFVRERAVAAA